MARLGGISAAAERLNMAKSGVSRHVAQLEAHLGVRLLERGARSVKLTPIGERLEHRIRSILAEVDLLNDIAREESAGIAGQVNIAATPEFGGLVASTLFPVFQAQHPELRLVMRTGYAFEDMQDPRTDLALRVGTFKDDRLVARHLGAFRSWMVASPEFLQNHVVNSVEDLTRSPCLVFRGDQSRTTWTLHRKDHVTPIEASGPIGVRNFSILLELAIAGRGIAFLPNFMLRPAIEAGALVRCLPDHASRLYPVFLTYRPGARRIARLDATIGLVEAHVPGLLFE